MIYVVTMLMTLYLTQTKILFLGCQNLKKGLATFELHIEKKAKMP
jgi:hypothetical protein